MSPRISVVISQHELRSGHRSEFEEGLITRLLFENGLDATLVSDLKAIEPDTTDHLCLEGLKGDFALLCWEDFEYASNHLERLIEPNFAVVSLENGSTLRKPSAHKDLLRAPKRVFFSQLGGGASVDSLVRSLKQLVESKSVPVVALNRSPNGNKQTQQRSDSGVNVTSVDSQRMNPSTPTAKVPSLQNSTLKPAVNPVVANMERIDVNDDEFPHIDQLVEEFVSFEL